MLNVTRKEFNKTSIDEILKFIKLNGIRPFYPESLICRFFNELTSSTNLVIDLFQGEKRVAVAVLLELVDNPTNSANLELIGCLKEIDINSVMNVIFFEAGNMLPTTRSGIQVGFHELLIPDLYLLESFGNRQLYNTYEMKNSDAPMTKFNLPMGYRWQKLSLPFYNEYYSILVESFKNNIETSIPSLEQMKLSFKNQKMVNTTLLFKDNSLIGFTNVHPDVLNSCEGEILEVFTVRSHLVANLGAT